MSDQLKEAIAVISRAAEDDEKVCEAVKHIATGIQIGRGETKKEDKQSVNHSD